MYLYPNKRHFLESLGYAQDENTIYTLPSNIVHIQVKKDVDEITTCKVLEDQKTHSFKVSSGRIYGYHPKPNYRLFPLIGSTNTITINKFDYKMLVLLKEDPESFEKQISYRIKSGNITQERVLIIRYLASIN